MNRLEQIIHELKHHAPFTLGATFIAILIVFIFGFVLNQKISENIFEIIHPMHILISAIVTSAIFYSYKKNIFYSILVGISGTVIIGSLSDVVFPYFGGLIFNFHPTFHLPLIEYPSIIIGVALFGSLVGIATKITRLPHFLHVLLSVFASLFYILAFSIKLNFIGFAIAFLIVFIAVIIPCCVSDIVFPFLFLGEKIKKCDC